MPLQAGHYYLALSTVCAFSFPTRVGLQIDAFGALFHEHTVRAWTSSLSRDCASIESTELTHEIHLRCKRHFRGDATAGNTRNTTPLDILLMCGIASVECLGGAATTERSDLLQGTLDMLILKVVALGPIHGYGISQRIRQISNAVLLVQQGSLYPALHRLEKRGCLEAEWGESENGREAKFYRLSARGASSCRGRNRIGTVSRGP